ncbi:MAG: catalase-related domain-containing protein [Paracoccaceae bacterium]
MSKFNLMSSEQKQILFENTAHSIGAARLEIQHLCIVSCYKADPAYRVGIAKALGIDLATVEIRLQIAVYNSHKYPYAAKNCLIEFALQILPRGDALVAPIKSVLPFFFFWNNRLISSVFI